LAAGSDGGELDIRVLFRSGGEIKCGGMKAYIGDETLDDFNIWKILWFFGKNLTGKVE